MCKYSDCNPHHLGGGGRSSWEEEQEVVFCVVYDCMSTMVVYLGAHKGTELSQHWPVYLAMCALCVCVHKHQLGIHPQVHCYYVKNMD